MLYDPVRNRYQPGISLVLLPNPLDRLCLSQPLCRLAASLGIVVVVILESSNLILKLLADLYCRAIPLDFGGEGDVADMREGVVYHARLGVISAYVTCGHTPALV